MGGLIGLLLMAGAVYCYFWLTSYAYFTSGVLFVTLLTLFALYHWFKKKQKVWWEHKPKFEVAGFFIAVPILGLVFGSDWEIQKEFEAAIAIAASAMMVDLFLSLLRANIFHYNQRAIKSLDGWTAESPIDELKPDRNKIRVKVSLSYRQLQRVLADNPELVAKNQFTDNHGNTIKIHVSNGLELLMIEKNSKNTKLYCLWDFMVSRSRQSQD